MFHGPWVHRVLPSGRAFRVQASNEAARSSPEGTSPCTATRAQLSTTDRQQPTEPLDRCGRRGSPCSKRPAPAASDGERQRLRRLACRARGDGRAPWRFCSDTRQLRQHPARRSGAPPPGRRRRVHPCAAEPRGRSRRARPSRRPKTTATVGGGGGGGTSAGACSRKRLRRAGTNGPLRVDPPPQRGPPAAAIRGGGPR